MKKYLKRISVLLFVTFFVFLASCSSDTGSKTAENNSAKIINELKSFTNLENTKNGFAFKYSGEGDNTLSIWTLSYTEDNEFVKIDNSIVKNSFIGASGVHCFYNDDGSFTYDFSDNAIRIYFDEDVVGISLLNYDLNNDEITVNSNGEKYYASDELKELLNDNDLVSVMKEDIESFKYLLNEHDLSYDEITNLNYEDIESYLK